MQIMKGEAGLPLNFVSNKVISNGIFFYTPS